MRKLAMRLMIGGLILTGAAACSTATSSTPSAPPASNVTGRWTGTYVFEPSTAGNGTATVNWTQSGSQLKGTLDVQGPHQYRPHVINAIMSGNDIQITGPDVTGWMKVNGNEMTGLINGVLPARVTLRKAQ
jgi:ABC-type glycerol-3-phosphate transport system substrate-binding protein